MRTLLLIICACIVFSTIQAQKPAKQTSKGASDPKELSDVLFYAIRYNNYDHLLNYLPGQNELNHLIKTSSEKNRPFFEDIDDEQISRSARTGFQTITRKGIQQQINWSSVELVDYQTKSCNIEEIGCNVSFHIQDANEKDIHITYDAVKVKGKWFIFQNLTLVE